MTYLAYHIATSLIAPWGALWLAAQPAHRRLLARFAPPVPRAALENPVWVQACSVGEVATARQIIQAMRRRWPDLPILLTVSTTAGYDLAQGADCGAPVTWFPFDHRHTVRRFLRAVKPRALLLIETEIWPNVLRETRRSGAPVVLLNGRLSDRHIGRYLRARFFFRPVVQQISAAGMQNAEYAGRLIQLGADPARVHVTGNTKFDGVTLEIDPRTLARTREENGFSPAAPTLVFGSTRPGDERLAATCWRTLRDEFPALRLIIAPRHSDRLHEAIAPFDEPLLRRSEVRAGRRPNHERVFVLDTVGELIEFYALATVAVIGGSFYPGVNGHNPLEPAALGVPTVFGPYMRNFMDPARELVRHQGAVQVESPEALLPALQTLLRDAEARARLADLGKKAVLENQGATTRSLALLETVLPNLG